MRKKSSGRHVRKESPDAGFLKRLDHVAARFRNRSEFARAAGLSPSTLQRYFEGGEPSRPVLIALARAGKVSLGWLATGQSPIEEKLPKGYFHLDFYDLSKADWYVYPLLSRSEPSDILIFKESWLVGTALKADVVRQLFAVEAGEDFLPLVRMGDLIVIDGGYSGAVFVPSESSAPLVEVPSGHPAEPIKVEKDALYLVAQTGRVRIAMLERKKRNSLSVCYSGTSEEVSERVMPGFHVVGRIIWVGRRL